MPDHYNDRGGPSRHRDDVNRFGKRRAADDEPQDLPQPYNAKELQSVKRRAVSPSEQPQRKQKRPGARARISEAEREAIRQRQVERDRQAASVQAAEEERERGRGINDIVRQHYNSVPERGRNWRAQSSRIKGLRFFNNWIKSCIIQRYSPDEDHAPGSREAGRSSGKELLVLDIGCGKGGDLGKWQSAPQPIQLYVGLDPADVSITQARDRYREMESRSRGGRGGGGGGRGGSSRLFDARFYVKDCYSQSIEDIPIIQEVGFDPSPMNRRGFDVVTMMFSMHYAFETEEKARTMLRNVAGALKKGGRFIGCIPNSDILSEHVRKFNAKQAAKNAKKAADSTTTTAADATTNGAAANDGSAPNTPDSPPFMPASPEPDADADDGEIQDGETKPKNKDNEDEDVEEGEAEPTAEWGNSIYRVRFPGKTPEDGIFRPAFGWKYSFFLDEAVEEVPEYVVPWEAFRALADDFNLELQFHRPFADIWEAEKDDPELGPLSERMHVRERGGGRLLVSDEEMEAASFYLGFCFYKV
jgi:mRNA (guanine-N7-)-methyltransferase